MHHIQPNFQIITAAILSVTLACSAEALPLTNGPDFVGIHANDSTTETLALGGTHFLGLKTSNSGPSISGDNQDRNDIYSNVSILKETANQEWKNIVSGPPICGDMLLSHARSLQKDPNLYLDSAILKHTMPDTFAILSKDFDQNNQELVLAQRDHLIQSLEPVIFCPLFHPLLESGDRNVAVGHQYIDIGNSLTLNAGEPSQFAYSQAAGMTLEVLQPNLAESTAVPEPGALSLIGIGLLGITWFVRRRQPSRRHTRT